MLICYYVSFVLMSKNNLLICYYVFNHYSVLLVNLKRYSVGYVETTKSKIRYERTTRHWLEVAEY